MFAMQHATRRNFFGWLNNPDANPSFVDRDFDDDENKRPVTAEPLDWYRNRHWPALARD